MANISAIKVGSTSYGITATPTSHASTETTYGAATASNYGHVKLSDKYISSAGAAASGIGASSKAVYDCYNSCMNSLNRKASIYRNSGSTESSTSMVLCSIVVGALCIGTFYSTYYIGYIRDTSTIIKIASHEISGMAIAFILDDHGLINVSITNTTRVPYPFAVSVFC